MVEFILIVLALFAWRIVVHLAHIRAELAAIAASNRAIAETIVDKEFLITGDEVPRSRVTRSKRELRPH